MKALKRHGAKEWSHRTVMDAPRNRIGVYAFWCRQSGKCIYVGKASERSIRARLNEHWRRSHNETLRLWIRSFGKHLDVCYASVKKHRIPVAERRLIRLWNPEANIQHKR